MEAIVEAGMTLNKEKCVFRKGKIKFWGLTISVDGTQSDLEKVKALELLTVPTNKDELISFLCMTQSHSEFIPNFSRDAAVLRKLIKKNLKFTWTDKHKNVFQELIKAFKEIILHYFDMNKQTYL